jgi:hypothetical protein
LVEQRGLPDRLTSGRGEHQENIQCATANGNRDAVAGQASAASVEPEWTELEILLAGRRHAQP